MRASERASERERERDRQTDRGGERFCFVFYSLDINELRQRYK